ncbi:hypothetical protein O181_033505 [Austropuccinia psidii MF-1]|uniref:Uncharacterized protein n=1 Tax=Austropuccinia psidii MF-1 TaxID=1389203 RepID=A0A9Q3D366_9BASI|nr:hypothetical protein [Austropuccinia psidii MF-1]
MLSRFFLLGLMLGMVFAATEETDPPPTTPDNAPTSCPALGSLQGKGPTTEWAEAANATQSPNSITVDECSANALVEGKKYAWHKSDAQDNSHDNTTSGICFATTLEPGNEDLTEAQEVTSFFWFDFPGMIPMNDTSENPKVAGNRTHKGHKSHPKHPPSRRA